MSDLEFIDYIYDPVWKNIPITKLEKEIIESNIFKRLKNIRQMSLASISFSGANHTRFEHSIGTMHVAYLVVNGIKKLREKTNQVFQKTHNIDNGYNKTIQFIRIAGLLHDLGHPPFSHAIEWVFERNPELYPGRKYSHDNYTHKLIRRNKELKKILNDNIISPENIANFLAKNLKHIPKPIATLYPLLNGDLDFDKIDYIIRDNYHCGLPVNVDIYSIMDSFKIRIQKQNPKEEEITIEIAFKPDKLFVIENLLLSRKQLIMVIQQEKKNRIANQMLMTGTQEFLKNKKELLSEKEYKKLIQQLHENWTDYDLVSNIAKESNYTQANYLNRAIKGSLMQEIMRIDMFDLEPKERLEFYLFNKFKEKQMTIIEKLNEKLKSNFLIDFVYIKPPPLTIRIVPDFEEKASSVEYGGRPLSFALHSFSHVINGILKDSFNGSFISVYNDQETNNQSMIKENLKREISKQNLQIRKELLQNKVIIGEDLILLVLAAIRDFTKEKFSLSRLWVTGVEHFQKFINMFRKKILFNCPDLDYLSDNYSSRFDLLMTKLVTLGLIDQRKKHVSLRTKGGTSDYRYLDRSDYYLNSNGEFFVSTLPSKLLDIKRDLYDKMIHNCDVYTKYLTRDFDLQDTIRQKDLRPSLEERGLPIIDI